MSTSQKALLVGSPCASYSMNRSAYLSHHSNMPDVMTTGILSIIYSNGTSLDIKLDTCL